jgi:MinD-like ATPase involved in chromosome partitioning or flagellar assembly
MSKIISIHSYRGGTGKSSLTANIAACVADEGYRVGMIDTDLPSPGIHVLFNVNLDQLTYKLNDFLWGRCAIKDTVCNVTHVLPQKKDNSQLYLVSASTKLADISRVLREGFDPEILLQGLQDLIKALNLDYLFIDTHPGLNEETLLSLTISNLVFLVLRPDQQDFQGTAVTIDVARRLKVENLKLVVNKVLKTYDFKQISQKISQTYGAPVVGIFPESEDMIRLASNGVFCLKYPNHPMSKMYQHIAQKAIAIS